MSSKRKASAGKTASRITLGTNPDIAAAGKLYSRLKQCAAKGTDVNLYADRVETIDTISLQLLLAFVRQVQENGNTVNWKSPSEAVLKTAALVGLDAELLLTKAA